MDQVNRLEKVSSLYGPGAFGGWLFTLLSVLVTWTADLRNKKKDSITNNLLFTLTLPTIASVHVFYKVGQYPGSTEELLTSQGNANLQLLATIEAPLNVCETFLTFAIVMVWISLWFGHRKRALSVLTVGILSLSTEIVLFASTRKADPSTSTFSRPFIFHIGGDMLSISIMFSALIIAFLFLLLVGLTSTPDVTDEQLTQQWTRDSKLQWVLLIGIIIICHYVFALFVSIAYKRGSNSGSRMLFFIPNTPVLISDLDQAVALTTGIVTLLFSIYGAIKSR